MNDSSRRSLLSTLIAVPVIWGVGVILAVSYATLIFSGELSPYLPAGIGLVLFSATIFSIIIGLISRSHMVAAPQQSLVAILAAMSAAIVTHMPADASGDERFYTVAAAIMFTSLLVGVAFLALGLLRLGNLIEYVPYPVVGGFLAGTGWLLARGAFNVMTGGVSDISILFDMTVVIHWLPGLLLAIVLLMLLRRYDHFLVMPGILLVAILLFYGALLVTNTPIEQAKIQGWLLGDFPQGVLWKSLEFSRLAAVDWSLILSQTGSLVTILLVGAVQLLLHASAYELLSERNLDLNQELRAAGIANIVSGVGGGVAGFHTLGQSTLAYKMQANSHILGVAVAGLYAVTFLLGAQVLAFLPRLVFGGLLLYLGLNFLVEWLYDARFKLPRADYYVMVLILLTVAVFGFLAAVGVGVTVAVVLFVINYSRIKVVKQALSGLSQRSNVERSIQHLRVLRQKGDTLYILKLQGFIFFGTANNLLSEVYQRVEDSRLPTLRYLVLDFRLVNGLDSSAVVSFVKMRQLAEAQGIHLIFANLTAAIRWQLERGGGFFTATSNTIFHEFTDLDHGLEWCENQILAANGASQVDNHLTLVDQLKDAFPSEASITRLMAYLEQKKVQAGYYLMRQGHPPEALYFIESGLVTAQLELDNGDKVRLRTMGAGTVVGETGLYLGQIRSASVVTEQPSVIYRLSSDALSRMLDQDPELAAAFHLFVARLLAERLVSTNNALQSLLD